MKPGPKNLITDIDGLFVGNSDDSTLKSGTTVLVGNAPFTTGVHVMGGAPGTRETDLLAPDKLVEQVDALVLSGGSAFGLDAASGVTDALASRGRGFAVGEARVPIVPAAILFDLLNGGNKAWGACNPYGALGQRALENAADDFELGTAGAGFGATTFDLKGGLGSASFVLENGLRVGALVAVNALGSVVQGGQKHFWAAPFEVADEFGGCGAARRFFPGDEPHIPPLSAKKANTTIAIVATDASLTQAQATRLAISAHDGMARAIFPSHTPYDGDLVFAVSTSQKPLCDEINDPLRLGHAAGLCLARAIARGVYAARPEKDDSLPCWAQKYG